MVTLDSCILSNLFSNVETCRLLSMACCLKAPHCWDAVPMRAKSHRFADDQIAAFTAMQYAHPWWHIFFESTFLKETHGETHKFHEKVSLEVGGFISNCWILMDQYLNAFWMHTLTNFDTPVTNLSRDIPWWPLRVHPGLPVHVLSQSQLRCWQRPPQCLEHRDSNDVQIS